MSQGLKREGEEELSSGLIDEKSNDIIIYKRPS